MFFHTSEQKAQVCAIAAVGCDRQIAAHYLGCRPEDLRGELERDTSFANDLVQAEAQAELGHMRNVKQAAAEEKNWRASVWWLERRAPDRYARRDAGAMSATQIQRFIESLSTLIAEEVRHAPDRDRLLERLQELSEATTDENEPRTAAINSDQDANLEGEAPV